MLDTRQDHVFNTEHLGSSCATDNPIRKQCDGWGGICVERVFHAITPEMGIAVSDRPKRGILNFLYLLSECCDAAPVKLKVNPQDRDMLLPHVLTIPMKTPDIVPVLNHHFAEQQQSSFSAKPFNF